jgi:hypothetical protein
VEDTLSDGILSGKFRLGSMVRLTTDAEGNLLLEPVEDEQPAEPEPQA